MVFIIVGLLILHGLRGTIGSAPFYMGIGLVLIFTQLVSATELKIITGSKDTDFFVAQTVFFLPYLTILLIVYTTEGILATQRLIIGAITSLGLYFYLSHLTTLQCTWSGFTISQGPSADAMNYLLIKSRQNMTVTVLAQILDVFLIPVLYQTLRNFKCRLFFCILGSLMLTLTLDSLLYATISYWSDGAWLVHFSSSYIAKVIATFFLSLLATIYVSRISSEIPGEGRGILDILFAFLGGYRKAQLLQRDVQEWEGRYSLLVENASDMILMLNKDGEILDANQTALKILQLSSRSEIVGRKFNDIIESKNGQYASAWEECRKALDLDSHEQESRKIHSIECFGIAKEGRVDLDIGITSAGTGVQRVLIAIGRDVTEKRRFEKEKEDFKTEVAHLQRLESIGRLAGGVAHDFNNNIHAIQGHLDMIKYMHAPEDPEILHHLEKIDRITEQAAKLTSQLLGFARKGKFVEKVIDLGDILNQSLELFNPDAMNNIELKVSIPEKRFFTKGDPLQLQQVILNLLINARDAMSNNKDKRRKLSVSLGWPNLFKVKTDPAMSLRKQNDEYCCIRIEDNGEGIPEKIRDRIFEPFFTTKPVGRGTGMGLAMAYGTITNHGGWIQLESQVGKGTAFYIFLPHCKKMSDTALDMAAELREVK